MILPNFFIIGAPKCGTSSLFGWLAQHPDVCGSLKKEPFFLMDPGNPLQGTLTSQKDGMAAYARLFPEGAERFAVRMEASTHYLYQEEALRRIPEIPNAKVCVVLRDPAVRVLSSFNYTKNNLARLKKDIDFAEYIELVRHGRSLYPDYCASRQSAYVLERDVDYSRYVNYVRPWLLALGGERIKILILEEFMDSPRAVVEDIVQWLGLGPFPVEWTADEARNETRIVRSRALHRLARAVGPRLGWLGPVKELLKAHYMAAQGPKLRASRSEDLSELRVEFDKSVEELESLIGRGPLWWRGRAHART